MITWMLVTLDGTRRSAAVVPHAIDLAKSMGCGVTLVRVLPRGDDRTPEMEDRETTKHEEVAPQVQEAESYLESVEGRFTKAGIMTWTDVRSGDPAAEILKAALNCKADLVTMATRSRSGLNKLVFGSVADQVLKDCEIPVLLITAR